MDLPLPLAIILAAIAWFGHAFLATVALNWCYAQPFRRPYLRTARAIAAALVFGFPIALVLAFLWTAAITGLPSLVVAYLALCLAVTLAYLPIISVVRACRRPPAEIVGNKSTIVDVAAGLGDKPVGDGKHWRMACLPFNQVFQVVFHELTIRQPRLPDGWDGLTILHVSDIHLCGTPGRRFFQYVFDRALDGGVPDILALTGDVIDSPHHHRWIVPLVGRLKWKIAGLAILGNHDSYYEPELVRRRLKRLGFHVLGNSWLTIDVRGEPLVVVGNEAPWFRPAPDLKGVPEGAFRLCLSHTPDNFGWAQQNDIDLMLAGHVHGGQVRLPGVGPLFVPSRHSRRYDSGQFSAGPTFMSVSRGLSGGEPLRYNCRPEVTRITLRPSTANREAIQQ